MHTGLQNKSLIQQVQNNIDKIFKGISILYVVKHKYDVGSVFI